MITIWRMVSIISIFSISFCAATEISLAASKPDNSTLPSAIQPFTTQSNYMSLTGLKRWQHFKRAGVWSGTTKVTIECIGESSSYDLKPEPIDVLKFLQKVINEKPFSREYKIYWTFDLIAANTEEWLNYWYVYKVEKRRVYGFGLNLSLDEELLAALILRWDALHDRDPITRQEARQRYEKRYGPITNENWEDWWKQQK